MRRSFVTVLAVLSVSLFACGGDLPRDGGSLSTHVDAALGYCDKVPDAPECNQEPEPMPIVMSPALAGTWIGSLNLSQSGVITQAWLSTVQVNLLSGGTQGAVNGLCPGGGGLVTVTADNYESGSWTGLYSCPVVPFNGCEAVVFTYEIVSISIGGDGLFHLNGTGRATGCDRTRVFYSVSLIGQRG